MAIIPRGTVMRVAMPNQKESKLRENQLIYLRFAGRSKKDSEGWSNVSNGLWAHSRAMAASMPELIEIDLELKRVRLTPAGMTVLDYLA